MTRIAIRLLVLACLSGCSGGDDPGSITKDEIVGYWTGDWGRMVLRDVAGEIRGSYDHDDGTLVGTLGDDGVLRGWWCEVPSRQAPDDAGAVEFRFARAGSLSLDGRWRYGAEGEWREDWDLQHVTEAPAADLSARFDDAAAFCRAP